MRVGKGVLSGGLVLLIPEAALAHAAERGLILLLPTGYYLWGGALAVGLSFAVLALVRGRLEGFGRSLRVAVPAGPGQVLHGLGFAIFAALIAAGWLGARDPLANPLPLMAWTVVWVGLTGVVAVVGDVWSALNPWSAPAALIRRMAGVEVRAPPRWVGHWPALAGLAAIAWFELVDLAPEDPARLARAALIYWLVHLAGVVAFGDPWRRQAEALSVFFALIGRIAPLRIGGGVRLGWPGGALMDAPALPVSGWIFVCAAIATVTFDGLSGSFWWLGRIGVNPLEFPGRSAVVWQNTAGLAATWAAMAAAFALTVAMGWALAGRQASLSQSLGRIALSLLPIALAYHLSHYLTVLLVNGQYALLALTDPMGTGADWLGLGAYPVTTSFLNSLDDVERIWQVQTGLIVGGHLLAVLIAHAIAMRIHGTHRAAMLSQVPLAVLMVAYTVLGLWLLSTPTAV